MSCPLRDRCAAVAASLAISCGCGARSELEVASGVGGGGAGGGAAASTTTTGPAANPLCPPGGPVVALAENLVWPYGIVTDETYAYFTTYDDVDGAIWRVPKKGGVLDALAADLDFPNQLVLVGDSLYATEAGANRIIRVPKEGGPVVVIATGQSGPSGLTTDGNALYWVNYLGDEIVRSTFEGDITVLGSDKGPFRIAVGPDRVYYTAFGADVRWIDEEGNAKGRFPSEPGPRTVAFSNGKVFWTDGGIGYANADGSEQMSFGDSEDATFWDGLTADADHVFTAVASGNIWRFSRHGEYPELIAEGQDGPAIVTADDTCVYWTNTSPTTNGAGSVMRAPRLLR